MPAPVRQVSLETWADPVKASFCSGEAELGGFERRGRLSESCLLPRRHFWQVFFLVFIGVELGQEVLEARICLLRLGACLHSLSQAAVAACRDRSEPSQALADLERSQRSCGVKPY